MKIYLFLIVSMKSLGKAALNTIIGLSIATSVHTQGPKKTEQCSQSTKNALIENTEMKKLDQTAMIIKCMAGILTKEELEQLLVDNGYKKSDSKYIKLTPDTLLYHTIQELESKYRNPHITFKRPKFVGEEYDGHFSKRKNTIQIHFQNLMQIMKKNKENKTIDFQGEILDIRLMEMSHKKQKITFKKKWKDLGTLIKLGLDYDEMYETEGTIEYEAHKILEPEIINEFLEIYAHKIDTTNAEQVERADYLFDRYEYTNKNPDTMNKNLMFMIDREEERSLNKMKNHQK